MKKEIFDDVLNNLKNSNLIKYFSSGADLPPPDLSTLTSLSESVVSIFVDNKNLCYRNADEEIVVCPFVDTNVSGAGYWLSDKIPSPNFDISQSGNIRIEDPRVSSSNLDLGIY
jgi:hypothetical protein